MGVHAVAYGDIAVDNVEILPEPVSVEFLHPAMFELQRIRLVSVSHGIRRSERKSPEISIEDLVGPVRGRSLERERIALFSVEIKYGRSVLQHGLRPVLDRGEVVDVECTARERDVIAERVVLEVPVGEPAVREAVANGLGQFPVAFDFAAVESNHIRAVDLDDALPRGAEPECAYRRIPIHHERIGRHSMGIWTHPLRVGLGSVYDGIAAIDTVKKFQVRYVVRAV